MNIKQKNNSFLDISIILCDILSVILSYYAVNPFQIIDIFNRDFNLLLSSYLVLIITLLYIYEFYTTLYRKKYDIIVTLLIINVITSSFLLIIEFFTGAFGVYKAFFLEMPILTFVFLTISRLFFLNLTIKTQGRQKLLVLEDYSVDDKLARKIKYSCLDMYDAWYIKIDVNDIDQIEKLFKNEFSQHECILLTNSIPEELKKQIISYSVLHGKEIFVVPTLYDIIVAKNDMVQFDDTPVLRVMQLGLNKYQILSKRALDVLASLFGIVLSLPIMLLIAIIIKIDSRGPILYTQKRVTINRKTFNAYKFRTMKNDAEKDTGPVFSTENDDRITRVGKVLRMLRLDELPQLFNILVGSMSIVGPRPERPVFVDEFCKTVDNYEERFVVKAGLTGSAQVYGKYNTDVKDKCLYDLIYIRDYSFWLDIKIILLTIKIIFQRESTQGFKTTVEPWNVNHNI